MSERHEVIIQGRDNLSPAFKEITRSADTLGRELNELEREGQKTGRGFENVKKGAVALGAASTALAGFLGDASRAAAESEVNLTQLETAIEATGKSAESMAEQIKAAGDAALQMSYDDDEALNALTALTTATGDADQAFELLSVTMDLARGKNMELAAAAEVVGKVAAGNLGTLSRYGIVLEEGATATEALATLQERFAGQAEAYAATQQGAFDRMANAWGNFMERVGGSDMVAPFQTALMVLPGVSAAFTGVGAAAGVAGPAILAAGRAAATARIGFMGLNVALGPVGLALAAGSAALAITEAVGVTDLFGKSASAAAVETDDFALALAQLRAQAGSSVNLAWIDSTISGLTTIATEADEQLDALFEKFETGPGAVQLGQTFAGTELPQDFWDEYYRLSGLQLTQEQIDAVQDDILAALTTPNIDKDALIGIYRDLYAQWQRGDLEAGEFVSAIDGVNGELHTLIPTAEEAAAASGQLAESFGDLERVMGTLKLVQMEANATGEEEIELWRRRAAAGDAYAKQILRGLEVDAAYAAQSEEIGQTEEERAKAAKELADTYRTALVPAIEGLSGALVTGIGDFEGLSLAGSDLLDVLTQLQGIGTLELDIPEGERWGYLVDGSDRMVKNWLALTEAVEDAGQALDGTLALFGTIDDLGARMEATVGIANELFGPDGNAFDGIGPLADLLVLGRLNQEQFNDAVAAGLSIQEDAAHVEMILNTVRAEQLPALAEQSNAYAQMIGHLANLAPAEQAHALAMMDSANQAKVAAAYSTAYSASLGEIPEDVATDIIANAARADPVIADLLTEFGLIEQGAEGDIQVNFPNGESMVSVTKDLTESIDALIRTMGGIPPLHIDADVEPAVSGLNRVGLELDAVDGQTAHVSVLGENDSALTAVGDSVVAVQNADGTTAWVYMQGDESGAQTAIGNVEASRAGLDGSTAMVLIHGDDGPFWAEVNLVDGQVVGTTYVNVKPIYEGGWNQIGFTQYQHGGVVPSQQSPIGEIPRAAHGRTVLVGEAGPEIVSLPAGSYVHTNPASRGMAGGGGTTVVLNNYGTIQGIDELAEFMAEGLAQAAVGRKRELGMIA